jgi:hypothetical protein
MQEVQSRPTRSWPQWPGFVMKGVGKVLNLSFARRGVQDHHLSSRRLGGLGGGLPTAAPRLDSLPCAERRFIISDVRDADQPLPLVLDPWSAPQRLLPRMIIWQRRALSSHSEVFRSIGRRLDAQPKASNHRRCCTPAGLLTSRDHFNQAQDRCAPTVRAARGSNVVSLQLIDAFKMRINEL